jgi:hypothetical protein
VSTPWLKVKTQSRDPLRHMIAANFRHDQDVNKKYPSEKRVNFAHQCGTTKKKERTSREITLISFSKYFCEQPVV